MFFQYQEGSLDDCQAYKPYTLVRPPALPLVLDPLAVIFLDNRQYITHPGFEATHRVSHLNIVLK